MMVFDCVHGYGKKSRIFLYTLKKLSHRRACFSPAIYIYCKSDFSAAMCLSNVAYLLFTDEMHVHVQN